tara:strand:+ start:914 stop:1165 length:252 start_codon:yes stop_codon:yes gene_type:complete
MSEYNYISKKFLITRKCRDPKCNNGKGYCSNYWIATDEPCKRGKDFVVIRRTGIDNELKNLPPNATITTKMYVPKSRISDKVN